ncbi:type II toxin-antitoxin system VapC family toxin [Aliarcobacter vitoriensis]|uniref:type II toxin-antitoxin system VapC family toxin n=1 Tax=Aliarcobacter vitoriensis TaxID=2011099 RepID=UPI003AB00AA1
MEIILDTNILIEILKNNRETIKEVEKYDIHHISIITVMELFYGALNKNELQKLKKFTELFNIIPIDEQISDLAKDLIYQYAKSHTLDIPDSLIASTAIKLNLPFLSYNKKDFKFIKNINLV